MNPYNTRFASKDAEFKKRRKAKAGKSSKGRKISKDELKERIKTRRKSKRKVVHEESKSDEEEEFIPHPSLDDEEMNFTEGKSRKKTKPDPMKFEKRAQHPSFQDSPLNVSSKISFGTYIIYEYRRTSTKKADDDLYHHHLAKPFDHNTIFAHGVSAFNREDMFVLVKFLLDNGSRHFTIRVMDETRFARNTVTCLKIYDILKALKTTFILEIDGQKYDFVRDYFTHLRERFIESEGSSMEKSRISKKSYAAKKSAYKNKKVLREHFINMMFVIAGKHGIHGVKDIVMETGMKSLNTRILKKHFEKNSAEIGRLKRKKKYTYAKCATSGNYFTVPARLAKRDDLFFKVMGFGGDSVMNKFFKDWMSINYLCCSAEEMEGPPPEPPSSEGPEEEEMEAGPAGPSKEGALNMDEVKWLVELYHSQHESGHISIDELTDRMSRLFTKPTE